MGLGVLRVVGFALDEDDLNHKVRINVYVGGTSGNSNVPQAEIIANKNHSQHNGHGFDDTISVPLNYKGEDYKGFQKIYLYALNGVGFGNFKEISTREVFIHFKETATRTVLAYTNKD